MNKKKTVALLLSYAMALASVVGLSACGRGERTSEAGGNSDSTNSGNSSAGGG